MSGNEVENQGIGKPWYKSITMVVAVFTLALWGGVFFVAVLKGSTVEAAAGMATSAIGALSPILAALGLAGVRRALGAILVFLVLLPAAGCATPNARDLSPSQESSATAAGGFGAQTVGGSQGQAQTPQDTPGGQATQTWYFASQGGAERLAALLAAAKENGWTADQTIAAIQASSGAPHTVTITTAGITVQGGSATATGAAGGTGAGGAAGTGNVDNR